MGRIINRKYHTKKRKAVRRKERKAVTRRKGRKEKRATRRKGRKGRKVLRRKAVTRRRAQNKDARGFKRVISSVLTNKKKKELTAEEYHQLSADLRSKFSNDTLISDMTHFWERIYPIYLKAVDSYLKLVENKEREFYERDELEHQKFYDNKLYELEVFKLLHEYYKFPNLDEYFYYKRIFYRLYIYLRDCLTDDEVDETSKIPIINKLLYSDSGYIMHLINNVYSTKGRLGDAYPENQIIDDYLFSSDKKSNKEKINILYKMLILIRYSMRDYNLIVGDEGYKFESKHIDILTGKVESRNITSINDLWIGNDNIDSRLIQFIGLLDSSELSKFGELSNLDKYMINVDKNIVDGGDKSELLENDIKLLNDMNLYISEFKSLNSDDYNRLEHNFEKYYIENDKLKNVNDIFKDFYSKYLNERGWINIESVLKHYEKVNMIVEHERDTNIHRIEESEEEIVSEASANLPKCMF